MTFEHKWSPSRIYFYCAIDIFNVAIDMNNNKVLLKNISNEADSIRNNIVRL